MAGLAELQNGLFEGQSVAIYIKSVIPQKMKIKLIIVEAYGKEEEPGELVYFEKGEHIDYWLYSPEGSTKLIETDFS